MRVSVDLGALSSGSWGQYGIRFLLDGLATVLAGLIAKSFGPLIGGVFLAFPAIFPAGATLIAKREQQKKTKAGLDGRRRGQEAAALDASGTTLGAMALASFAIVIWVSIATHAPPAVLLGAALLWPLLSIGLWWLSEQDSGFRRLRRGTETRGS